VHRSRLLGLTSFVIAGALLWVGVELIFFTIGSAGVLWDALFFGVFLVLSLGALRAGWVVWDDPVVMTVDPIRRSVAIRKRTFVHSWRFSVPLDQIVVTVGPMRAGRSLVAHEWVIADLGAPGWVALGRAGASDQNRELAEEIASRWSVVVEESGRVRIGSHHTCHLLPSGVRQFS